MKRVISYLTFWKAVAAVILAVAAYSTFVRFYYGLGASTALTDEMPWGLWIGFDVLVGVGLASSGFTIAAAVHIFNLKKFSSVGRPSVVTAFLGYLLVMVALAFEIGRPLRLWHPLIMWNPHSVMFEVAWCVMLYTMVLALEFSPMVLERFKLKALLKIVRTIYLPVVVIGVTLSTLHQSSLGTYFLIVPDKVYGLWYTPLLPIFFFISAIAGGLGLTILQSFLSARAFHRELKRDVILGLAQAIVVVLAIYLVWKFRDLAHRGNLGLAFEFTPKSVMFWLEVGVGGLLPALIIFCSGIRIRESNLFLAALLVVIGFALNRMNVSITGMAGSENYFPKWTEVGISLGLVTTGFIMFVFAVKYLPVFPAEEKPAAAVPQTLLPVRSLAALWAIVILGGAAFALSQPKAVAQAEVDSLIRPVDVMKQTLERMPADQVITGGEDSPGPVKFSHADHIDTQDSPDCRACHARAFGFKLSGGSVRYSGEEWHSPAACGSCHDGKGAFKIKGNCESCHQEEE